jgi:glycosyltransferase involved in cell wall biosynthesis
MKEKILLIWDRIGDYHAARFLALEKKYGAGNVLIADLGAADLLYKWKNPLSQRAEYQALSDRPVEEKDSAARLAAFKKLVKTHNIRIAGIAGYGRPEYRNMLLWCRMNGVRVVLFAETWYPGKLDSLKGLFLRFTCRGFLVSGQRAKEHFSSYLGLDEQKIRLPYSVVDNGHFAQVSPDYENRKILCLARFSPEKNLLNLIKAYRLSGISEQGWSLDLVGGGPMKDELEKESGNGIQLRDWVSYGELPSLYASAGVFILPSSFEPWGLVVNEAMAAGLPVLVSEECGCAPDLVPEKNFRFPAGDPTALAGVLKKIAGMEPSERKATGERNRNRIAGFSPEAWADAFLALASK